MAALHQRRPVLSRLLGETHGARIGSVAMLAGGLLVAYAALWQVGLAPGLAPLVTAPAPVALAGAARDVALNLPDQRDPSAPLPPSAEGAAPDPVVLGPDQPPTVLPPLAAADRADRIAAASAPKPGYATRLAIPSVGIDTAVQQGGTRVAEDGSLEWETLPFIAVHYGDLTALIGAPGNAVIAGHVATLNEGNVFRDLYRVELDDRVEVEDDHGTVRTYAVNRVRLVDPGDVSVVAPTTRPTLTLITCGGTFDPVRREFSERLVVIASPIPPSSPADSRLH